MLSSNSHLCSPNPSSGYGSAEEEQFTTCESISKLQKQRLGLKIKVPANLSIDTRLLPSRSWPTSPEPLSLPTNVFITPSADSQNPLQLIADEYSEKNLCLDSLNSFSHDAINCGRSISWQGPSDWSDSAVLDFPACGTNLLSTLLTTRLETKFLSEVEKHRVKKHRRHPPTKLALTKSPTSSAIKHHAIIDISDHQYSSTLAATPAAPLLKRHCECPLTSDSLQLSSNPPSILETLLLTQEPLHPNKGSDFFVERFVHRCDSSRIKLTQDVASADIIFDSDFKMDELPLEFIEGEFGGSLSRLPLDAGQFLNVGNIGCDDNDDVSVLQSWIPSFIDDMKFCQELEEIFLEQTQETDPWLQPFDNL